MGSLEEAELFLRDEMYGACEAALSTAMIGLYDATDEINPETGETFGFGVVRGRGRRTCYGMKVGIFERTSRGRVLRAVQAQLVRQGWRTRMEPDDGVVTVQAERAGCEILVQSDDEGCRIQWHGWTPVFPD